jgi:hypothetical protein
MTEPSLKQQQRVPMRWLLVGATVISSAALLLGSNKLLGLRYSDRDFNLAKVELTVQADAESVPNAACKLQFVKYISSEWEQQWAKNANKFVPNTYMMLSTLARPPIIYVCTNDIATFCNFKMTNRKCQHTFSL